MDRQAKRITLGVSTRPSITCLGRKIFSTIFISQETRNIGILYQLLFYLNTFIIVKNTDEIVLGVLGNRMLSAF